jgi:hypothetical protein
MKKLILGLSVVIASLSMVACSKDKGSGNGNNNYNNGYNNGYYGNTPNDPRCNGGYAGYPYQGYQQGAYYGQQIRPNCIPQNAYIGGNPYYFQINSQMYMGTCDTRYAGRSQLCPSGYYCQTSYGSTGVCMRGYGAGGGYGGGFGVYGGVYGGGYRY